MGYKVVTILRNNFRDFTLVKHLMIIHAKDVF